MAGRVLTKRERDELKGKPQQLADLTWLATKLLEKLGLYTAEVYARSREDIVKRQSKELLELSTPVVELWEGIILLPLIGTLDSEFVVEPTKCEWRGPPRGQVLGASRQRTNTCAGDAIG